MGNENHQHHYKSTFLPILCSRPSIKDVTLPRCRNQPASSCNDPLSPRIGCMGQVKRNNKIAGFPTSSQYRLLTFSNKTSAATISPVVKYSKLKSLFSGKNLSSTPSITSATTTSSCRAKQRVAGNSSADVSKNQSCSGNRNTRRNENVVVAINIDAMDPPLPVVKRVEEGRQVDSLWKRRSGGPTIKRLQLQHPNICPQPTTV